MHTKVDIQIAQCVHGVCALQSSSSYNAGVEIGKMPHASLLAGVTQLSSDKGAERYT